jgi:hypothetical protein
MIKFPNWVTAKTISKTNKNDHSSALLLMTKGNSTCWSLRNLKKTICQENDPHVTDREDQARNGKWHIEKIGANLYGS